MYQLYFLFHLLVVLGLCYYACTVSSRYNEGWWGGEGRGSYSLAVLQGLLLVVFSLAEHRL